MQNFTLQDEQIDLPRGAYFKSGRKYVSWQGRPVIGLSQNDYRAYLFPVYTPKGFSVTTEAPCDHPHHNSVWVGADHVNCLLPFAKDQYEEATYNFYINETFQGRAAGRIVSESIEYEEVTEDCLRIVQSLLWRGPVEWGAPHGRTIAAETRTITIQPDETSYTIDIRSQLRPTDWNLRIGPTRHAYFGIRLTEPLRPSFGAALVDSAGRRGAQDVSGEVSDWIHFSGEVAAGHQAGVGLLVHPKLAEFPWHVHEWGTVDVNPLRNEAQKLTTGEQLDVAIRIIVHDGPAETDAIAEQHREYLDSIV